jgi:hypothetical protein
MNPLLKLENMNIKGGDGTIFGCGNCGKTKLKKWATSEKKRSNYEKIIVYVGAFYEMLIVVELEGVVMEGLKEG